LEEEINHKNARRGSEKDQSIGVQVETLMKEGEEFLSLGERMGLFSYILREEK
jgi:hypothetical protein